MILELGILAVLQTTPVQVGPSLAVTFHAGTNFSCAGIEVDQWPMVYGERCNPDPPVMTVPFIQSVLVRLTPVSPPLPTGPATIRSIARANVYVTNDVAGCLPQRAPCQSVRVLALPGLQTIEVALVTASGEQSDWAYVGSAEGRFNIFPIIDGRVRP